MNHVSVGEMLEEFDLMGCEHNTWNDTENIGWIRMKNKERLLSEQYVPFDMATNVQAKSLVWFFMGKEN